MTTTTRSRVAPRLRIGPKGALFATTAPAYCMMVVAAAAGAPTPVCAQAAAAPAVAAAAAVGGSTSVTEVVVTAHDAVQNAKDKLEKIPGAVSVISGAEVNKSRVQTNADLLKLVPGVIAEATGSGGLTAVKVSIRGSGVNNGVGYFRQGIKYEYDDLPITTPGGDPYELFDPSGLNRTEVLPGDDAFTTGALALGGTVNFVSNTGRTAPYTELRTEGGSYGYFKAVASTGGVDGPWDYYVMFSGASKSGFQQHSSANTEHVSASIGYQFSPDVETRVYYHYGRDFFASPGALTRAQISSDPSQAQLSALETGYTRLQPGTNFIGDVTKIKLNDTENLEIGASFQDYPIQINPSNTAAPTRSIYTEGAVAAQVKYTNTKELLNHRNNLTVAGYWTDDIYEGDKITAIANNGTYPFGRSFNGNAIAATTYYGIGNVTQGLLYRFNASGSTDATGLISDDFETFRNVWLTLGVSYVATPRNYYVTGHSGTDGHISSATLNQSDQHLIPRLGVRWDVDPHLQLFASYGGNVEPKQDWQGAYGPSSSIKLYPEWHVLDLKPQTAYTYEVGFRGRYGIFQGTADFFHSDVHDELISITDPVLQITTTLNAPPSTHQGVESSLDTLLWQWGSGPWNPRDDQRAKLHFVQVYDWNDFHFNGDSTFHRNVEPGLPEHYYQGELAFSHPTGIYADFDVRYSSSVWVDYLNTARAAPNTVLGLTVGWQQYEGGKKGWQLSLNLDNLTDKKYAVAVAPTYSAAHTDVAAEYPGDGRSVTATVDYKF